jgi:hypothetical protein
MKKLNLMLLLTALIFSLINIGYEFYLTAAVTFISVFILVYVVSKYRKLKISRISLLLLFFFSYPLQIIIILTGNSTLSPTSSWKNQNFYFEDIQSAYVILIALLFYLIFISLHILLCKMILSHGEDIYDYKSSKLLWFKNMYPNPGGIFKISKINIYLNFTFLFLFTIILFQNDYGWGVHGLPALKENVFRLVGISIYLRDYILPILLITLLAFSSKINLLTKVLLLFFSLTASITSLSKVTLLVYFFILVFAFNREQPMLKKNIARPLIVKSLIWLFLTAWGILLYFLLVMGRLEFINEGSPIRNQLFLVLNLELINAEGFREFLDTKHIFSFLQRFLGFEGLASAIYFDGNFNYRANFLHELMLGDSQGKNISSNELIGLESFGFGVDWISKLIMTGYYMVIPAFLILLIFFFQVLIIKKAPKKYKLILESAIILIFIRFSIDGNLVIIKWFSLLLPFVLLGLVFSIKEKRQKTYK